MYLQPCTAEQLRDIYAEFGATEESIREDVKHLQEWLAKQPHLPNVKDEKWLSNFLLRCKNSLERTKRQLDVYFTARATYPEIFIGRDFTKMEKDISLFAFVPMPKLTPSGVRVLVSSVFEHHSSELPTADDVLKGMQTVFDHSLIEDRVRGLILIIDGKNYSMALVSMFIQIVNKYVMVQNKVNPLRYQKVYYLNMPAFTIPMIVAVVNTFIKKEGEKLVVWRKESSKLVEDIPAECLPQEYGGTESPIREMKRRYENYLRPRESMFAEHDQMVADLTKKVSDTDRDESMYGVSGSFRKLCVD